jgi:hypothetical protein
MATVMFGFAGREPSSCGCDLFPGAFVEVLRLAALYKADSVWCLPLDVWRLV